MSLATSAVRFPIHVYRAIRPPRLPVCRYVPSCSEYALEAIDAHGAIRGSWLSAKRIVRCAPWGGWGSDPVPPRTQRSAST